MGIRGLNYYMESCCRGGFYDVDIAEVARRYQARTAEQPVLVVDTMSCVNFLYGGRDLDWACGGQFRQYVDAWQHFLSAFSNAGIRLVFVFDGTSVKAKRQTWVQRRYDTATQKVFPAFDCLEKGKLPGRGQNQTVLPSLQTKYVLRNVFNCEVITSMKEADEETVEVAIKHNAIGILGQDSDYVIYSSSVPYLSTQHLQLSTLRTKLYDRCSFARQIGIEESQLPIFAVLIGNDVIDREELLDFHNWLTDYRAKPGRSPDIKQLAPALGCFIRNQNFPRTKQQIYRVLPKVAADIFKNERRAKDLEQVVRGYFVDSTSGPAENTGNTNQVRDSAWDDIVNVVKCLYLSSDTHFPFSPMIGQPYESATAFEDYRLVDSLPSYNHLWTGARRRLWGILLHQHPGPELPDVTEYCMLGLGSLDKPVLQTPQTVSVHHPGLIDLHKTRTKDMQEARWRLLAWGVHPTLDPCMLASLHPARLYCVMALYYIQHAMDKPLLQDWEVKVFILQQILLQKMSDNEVKGQPSVIPGSRGAHITVWFTRTFLPHIASAVGDPCAPTHLMNYSNFDGLLFQRLYNEAKQGTKVIDLCKGVTSVAEEVEDLYNKVK